MFKNIILKSYKMLNFKKSVVTDYPVIKKDTGEVWLKKFSIKTFIDIGAFVGEYVDFANSFFPRVKIFAFEPLNYGFKVLKEKEKKLKNLKTYNYALGDRNARTVFYESEYKPSSSILKMESLHKSSFPFTKNYKKKFAQIRKLDDVLKSEELTKDLFVKIDTQGYEDKVILGGINTISKATVIQTEVSFFELYSGQVLFDQIYNMLSELDFLFMGFHNQVRSPKSGMILQAHAYFIHKSKVKILK